MISRTSSVPLRMAIGLSLGLLAYNSTVQLVPARNALYVPLNLAAMAILGLVSARAGLTLSDLGLARPTRRSGLILGIQVAIVIAAALLLAVATPPLAGLFADARVAEVTPALLAYRALIRIPLGTALFEEFAFRGVLFGAWFRTANRWAATVASSVVFGLWHIRPTLDLLDANQVAGALPDRVLIVALAVVGTTAAGVAFCLLRVRSGSLIAPLIAHTAANSLALVAAAMVNGL